MHEYDGVGLAAPQVHVDLRLAVIEVPESDERAQDAVPFTVLVNPVVHPLSEAKLVGYEGCLSIPDLRGLVPRYEQVHLEALDRHGRPWVLDASGFFARVIQHECDHLDGRVYLDRMSRPAQPVVHSASSSVSWPRSRRTTAPPDGRASH